jgi:hypothetical protein
MDFNVGAGSRCLICFDGTDSKMSFRQYLRLFNKNSSTLPPEIHVFINASYFDAFHQFHENTEDSRRVYGFVQKADIENMWSGRNPDGCRITFNDSVSTTICMAEHYLDMVGVNDLDMTFDEAAMINPTGTIKRIHNEGVQLKHCWIHTEYEKSLTGNSLKKCLGCHAVYGVNEIKCALSGKVVEDNLNMLRTKIRNCIEEKEIACAIGFINDHYPSNDPNFFMKLIEIAISEGSIEFYNTLHKQSPAIMKAETNYIFECLTMQATTLEVFAHVVKSELDIDKLNHNPISAIIQKYYYSSQSANMQKYYCNSQSCMGYPRKEILYILKVLRDKVDILLSAGIDPRRTYSSSESSAFDMMSVYYTYFMRDCSYAEDIFDSLFKYVKNKKRTRDFDPNSVFDFDKLILQFQIMKNPICFLKYMHEKQGAAVDYTTKNKSNIFFYICDDECIEYLGGAGVNVFQINTDGQNIVTFILEKLIQEHIGYSNADVAEYLGFIMFEDVNKDNEVQTIFLAEQLIKKYENISLETRERRRDIKIFEFFKEYYRTKYIDEKKHYHKSRGISSS